MSRGARLRLTGLLSLAGVALASAPHPLVAQHASVGPDVGVADYREVSASLRYRGIGPGLTATFQFHRFGLDGRVVWLQMNPAQRTAATESFRATQVDGWVYWQALDYLTVEAGFTHRTPDAEFAAQSVGAVRVGARTSYGLGRGATISLRGDYLAGAQFSGGGSAPLALELGLALDLVFSRRFRAALDYSFQRFDRSTNPGGGPTTNAAIEQALARLGVQLGL